MFHIIPIIISDLRDYHLVAHKPMTQLLEYEGIPEE